MEVHVKRLPGDSRGATGAGSSCLRAVGCHAALNVGLRISCGSDLLPGWLTESLHLNLICGARA